eukprot:9580814-Alexandrium_andersonii.AAC.1
MHRSQTAFCMSCPTGGGPPFAPHGWLPPSVDPRIGVSGTPESLTGVGGAAAPREGGSIFQSPE